MKTTGLPLDMDQGLPHASHAVLHCAGDGKEPAAGREGPAQLQDPHPERGRPPEPGGTAQPEAHHGEVLLRLPPRAGLLQHLQGAPPLISTSPPPPLIPSILLHTQHL